MIVSFTGHRPNKLAGFDWDYPWKNPAVTRIKDRLYEVLVSLIRQGATTFISGGALGVDQIAFYTVELIKREYPRLRNIVAVPYANQPQVWKNQEILTWYHKMLQLADQVIYVDTIPQYNRTSTPHGVHHNYKLQIRNEYMVDHSDVLVAVWDGSNGGTGNCVQYAKSKAKQIIQVSPN